MSKGLPMDVIKKVMNRRNKIIKRLLEWGDKNYRPYSWRNNRTPYSVLISEILLKRTTATAAAEIYDKFLASYPNLQALANAQKQDLERMLVRIGYHKRRAQILLEVARYLLEKHKGQIPAKKEELLKVPHIGPYTANAILSLGYGIPAAMVDSNVQRIISRLFSTTLTNKSPNAVQAVADLLAPKKDNVKYNYALLDLGALVCRYDLPKCSKCPLQDICDYCQQKQA